MLLAFPVYYYVEYNRSSKEDFNEQPVGVSLWEKASANLHDEHVSIPTLRS